MTKRVRSRFAYGLLAAGAVLALLAPAPAFSADQPKLVLHKGDRIILIGNTLAERMQYFGHFETLLHARFPAFELIVHNLGYSADELTLRPRQAHFDDHGHTLEDEKPDVLIAAFGFNESFAGPAGLAKFKDDLEKFIRVSTSVKYNGKKAPRAGFAFADRPRRPQEPPQDRRQEKQRKHQALCRRHGRAGRQTRRGLCRSVHSQQATIRGQQPPADDQRRPSQRRRLPATRAQTGRSPLRPVSPTGHVK